MRRFFTSALFALSLAFVCAGVSCAGGAEPASVSPISPDATIAPRPTVSPADSMTSPAPTPTPVSELEAARFLPFENVFLAYSENERSLESYVEYYNADSGLLQRHMFPAGSPPYVEVFSLSGGCLTLLSRYENISYIYDFTREAAADPNVNEPYLKMPVSVGTSWSVNGGACSVTAVDMPVQLASHSYSVVETTTIYAAGGSCVRQFSAGLGLIAEYRYDQTDTLYYSATLLERERDRPYIQRVRLYFADQSDLTVRYVDRDISFAPNTDVSRRLSDELKKVPSGSPLVPMPGGGFVKSADPNYKDGVKLELTDEFVTQMQVGRSGERLRLQALTNTFGAYYGKSAVYLRLEGRLYESPYFMFINEGEYLTVKTASARKFEG